MSRNRILALVLIPTLLVVTVIATVLVLRMLDRREQVDAADSAAKTYNQELTSFRDDVTEKARQSRTDGAKLAAVVDDARDDLPELADATEHGIKQSKSYREAQRSEEQIDDDLDDLAAAAEGAKEIKAFVAAAEKPLARSPLDRLSGSTFSSGAPIRRAIIVPISKELAAFKRVKVPKGAEATRSQVILALRFAIKDARRGAKALDSGRSTSINPNRMFPGARLAVYSTSASIGPDLDKAIDTFSGEAKAPEGDSESPSETESPDPI